MIAEQMREIARDPEMVGRPVQMKIGVVTSSYPRDENDANVPWLREAVRGLVKCGHEVKILAPSYKGLGNHEIDQCTVNRFRYAPAPCEDLTHDAGAPSRIRNPLYRMLTIPYVISGILNTLMWCRKERIDILQVHWPVPHGLFALLPSLFLGTKVQFVCHGAEMALCRKSRAIAWLMKTLTRVADNVVCNSSHTKNQIEKITGCDAAVIPYGTSVKVRSTQRCPREEGGKLRLLFSGRHVERKGVDYLLKAMPSILSRMDAELVLTGHGDQTTQWKELSASLGLDDHVHFAGTVSQTELSNLYNESDIFVLPAIYDRSGDTEGLGVVLVEALSSGCAVVASGVGGIVDVIINGQTGLTVPEKNSDALADAIVLLGKDRELASRLAIQGMEHISTNFNWSSLTAKTEIELLKGLNRNDQPDQPENVLIIEFSY